MGAQTNLQEQVRCHNQFKTIVYFEEDNSFIQALAKIVMTGGQFLTSHINTEDRWILYYFDTEEDKDMFDEQLEEFLPGEFGENYTYAL